MTADSPWLTIPEAMTYARCGKTTLYQACRTGDLKATQVGTPGRAKWVIHRDAVDRWLGAPTPARTRRRSA